MRYLIAVTCALLLSSAIAEDQPYDYRYVCDGADVILWVTMKEPGTLQLRIAHDTCGKDI